MWLGLRKILSALLRFGRLPDHVAIIMDGNRRYAARKNMESLGGHNMGYRKVRNQQCSECAAFSEDTAVHRWVSVG